MDEKVHHKMQIFTNHNSVAYTADYFHLVCVCVCVPAEKWGCCPRRNYIKGSFKNFGRCLCLTVLGRICPNSAKYSLQTLEVCI